MNLSAPRHRRTLLLFAAGASLLAGLIVWDLTHPSADEQAEAYVKRYDKMTQEERRKMSQEQREAMRADFDKLPPATREKVTARFVRQGVEQMRKEMAKLSPDQRRAKIAAEVERMQTQFAEISDEEREKLRQRLNDPQRRNATTGMMNTVQAALTLEERELFDPMIREMLGQIESLGAAP